LFRSLAPIGEKIVVRVVQSAASLTHSYTVMPLVFADGSMGDFLFVVLQEPGGKFPKTKRIFSASNLVVCAGTSHIMTKNHMKEWIAKVRIVSSFPLITIISSLSI
jgi:hypothetical protein